MALNAAFAANPRTKDVFVNNLTTKSGDPVRVGGFNGVAQYNSDGGVLSGHAPSPRGTAVGSKYNVPLWTVIAISGAYKLPITFTAARAQGDPIYITAGGVLTDVVGSNFIWGYLDTVVTGAGLFSVVVFIACPVA